MNIKNDNRNEVFRRFLDSKFQHLVFTDYGYDFMYKQKAVIYHHNQESIYIDGKLAIEGTPSYPVSAFSLLQFLGYEVEDRHVHWENMPHNGEPSRRIIVPAKLEDLEEHLLQLKRKRRRESIQSMKEELKRLEEEEYNDVVITGIFTRKD